MEAGIVKNRMSISDFEQRFPTEAACAKFVEEKRWAGQLVCPHCDPMGRQLGSDGNTDIGDIRLPDRGAIVRAREILEELHRRAGQWHRPAAEQDYLRRLLRRF